MMGGGEVAARGIVVDQSKGGARVWGSYRKWELESGVVARGGVFR